jgi:hypothetical protein
VPPSAAEEHIFKRKFDAEYTQEQRYEENKKKAFAMIYEHCTPELKALLKGDDRWGTLKASQDCICLLRMIKGLCCKFDPTRQEVRAIVAADKAIMCYIQEGHVTNSHYFEHFNALVDTVLSYGSIIGHSKALVNSELVKMETDRENATNDQKAKALGLAQESYLAMMMLNGANYFRFSELREELDNDFAKGHDTYPSNRNAVLRLLNSRKNSSIGKSAAQRATSPPWFSPRRKVGKLTTGSLSDVVKKAYCHKLSSGKTNIRQRSRRRGSFAYHEGHRE